MRATSLWPLLTLCLLVWAGCSGVKQGEKDPHIAPAPPLPPNHPMSIFAASNVVAKMNMLRAVPHTPGPPPAGPPQTFQLHFRFPTNIILTNYWWSLQSSTDLVHWSTIPTKLTTTNEPWVTNTGRMQFFRVEGTP